jgi:hypothetical protein
MGNVPTCQPALPDSVLRARLESVRGQLAELERCCPPELGLDVALDVLEVTLRGLGWSYPEPLSDQDREFLAICETGRSAR